VFGTPASTIVSWVAIYVVVWWIAIFAVLPIGVRSQDEAGAVAPGSDPGAPAAPRLLMKALVTTIIAALVTGLIYLLRGQLDSL
jgi:predicted secreted protein